MALDFLLSMHYFRPRLKKSGPRFNERSIRVFSHIRSKYLVALNLKLEKKITHFVHGQNSFQGQCFVSDIF